jgi:hypothetical protein
MMHKVSTAAVLIIQAVSYIVGSLFLVMGTMVTDPCGTVQCGPQWMSTAGLVGGGALGLIVLLRTGFHVYKNPASVGWAFMGFLLQIAVLVGAMALEMHAGPVN